MEEKITQREKAKVAAQKAVICNLVQKINNNKAISALYIITQAIWINS